MKDFRHHLWGCLFSVFGLVAFTSALGAQTPESSAPAATATEAKSVLVAPAGVEPKAAPVATAPSASEVHDVTNAPAAAPSPAEHEPSTTPAASGEESKLRRLDIPEASKDGTDSKEMAPAEEPARKEEAAVGEAKAEQDPDKVKVATNGHRRAHSGQAPFGNHTVAADRSAFEAFSILGSSTVDGEVQNAAVSILGNTLVNGTTGAEAVAVLGNVTVNGTVGGEAVAVLGDVNLGPKAVVQGGVVTIGGRLNRDPASVVKGEVQEITLPGLGDKLPGLKSWVKNCLLWGRPLAFARNLTWAWMIAITVFACYVLLALLFPRALEKCAETLEQRPGSSLLAVVLTVLITPVLVIVLVITGVGLLLLPFLIVGLLVAGVFGKAVMHAWLGRRITRYFNPGPMSHVATATLIGGVLVLLLYTVPVLGFIIYKALDVIGLGVVIYALILGTRREKPAPAPMVTPGTVLVPPAAEFQSMASAGAGSAGLAYGAVSAPVPPVIPPANVAAASLPRAGFWIRIAASMIDAVLIGMLAGFTNTGGAFPALFAIYCAVLWALKGTTIGGIVCGLKVVRLDDRKVDWVVALVRCLGGFLSMAVAGLGFIWVAFDEPRQSWHDKIAGTTIVHVPKGMSLL